MTMNTTYLGASPRFNRGRRINVINQRLGYLVRCGAPDALDSIVPMAFGNLALAYDSASILSETDDPEAIIPLSGYQDVMSAALRDLDTAIAILTTTSGVPALRIACIGPQLRAGQQPIRRLVPLARLLDQLRDGLEEVRVESGVLIHLRHLFVGSLRAVAVVADQSSRHRPVLLLDKGIIVLASDPAPREGQLLMIAVAHQLVIDEFSSGHIGRETVALYAHLLAAPHGPESQSPEGPAS